MNQNLLKYAYKVYLEISIYTLLLITRRKLTNYTINKKYLSTSNEKISIKK